MNTQIPYATRYGYQSCNKLGITLTFLVLKKGKAEEEGFCFRRKRNIRCC